MSYKQLGQSQAEKPISRCKSITLLSAREWLELTIVTIACVIVTFFFFNSSHAVITNSNTPITSSAKEAELPKDEAFKITRIPLQPGKEPGTCTGFLLELYSVGGEKITHTISAGHCLAGWPYSVDSQNAYLIHDGELKIKNNTPTHNNLLIVKPEHTTHFGFDDIMMFRVSTGVFQNTLKLPLANRLPVSGEVVSFVGYPQGGKKEKAKCVYLGTLMSTDVLLENRVTVKHSLFCPELKGKTSVAGASGGPVLNENGEVIGIMHAEKSEPLNALVLNHKNPLHPFHRVSTGHVEFEPLTRESFDLSGRVFQSQARDGQRLASVYDPVEDRYLWLHYTLRNRVVDGPVWVRRPFEELLYVGNFEAGKKLPWNISVPGAQPVVHE